MDFFAFSLRKEVLYRLYLEFFLVFRLNLYVAQAFLKPIE